MAKPKSYATTKGACLSCRWSTWDVTDKNGQPKRGSYGTCEWPAPELVFPVCFNVSRRPYLLTAKDSIWREQSGNCPTWEAKGDLNGG
jgi:hypothetical protein